MSIQSVPRVRAAKALALAVVCVWGMSSERSAHAQMACPNGGGGAGQAGGGAAGARAGAVGGGAAGGTLAGTQGSAFGPQGLSQLQQLMMFQQQSQFAQQQQRQQLEQARRLEQLQAAARDQQAASVAANSQPKSLTILPQQKTRAERAAERRAAYFRAKAAAAEEDVSETQLVVKTDGITSQE